MKKVLGIVGMPAAGKSTALEIAQNYCKIVVMGDIIREETQKRGLEINSKNIGQTAKDLRKEEGPEVIAKRTIDIVAKIPEETVIIDGIRSMDEVNLFRRHFNFKIIAITAEDDLRHQWILSRKRADDSQSMDEIKERDAREIGFGIKEVIINADITIKNDKTVEELKQKCNETFEELLNLI
jgi:dephospho-CoA kinase